MPSDSDGFVDALGPVVAALGGTVIEPGSEIDSDLPVEWGNAVVCFVRGSAPSDELHGALARIVAQVEQDFGATLAELDREQKQLAIRRLDEQGAFLLRGSVEDVASLMGVSRVTLYTYINAVSK